MGLRKRSAALGAAAGIAATALAIAGCSSSAARSFSSRSRLGVPGFWRNGMIFPHGFGKLRPATCRTAIVKFWQRTYLIGKFPVSFLCQGSLNLV